MDFTNFSYLLLVGRVVPTKRSEDKDSCFFFSHIIVRHNRRKIQQCHAGWRPAKGSSMQCWNDDYYYQRNNGSEMVLGPSKEVFAGPPAPSRSSCLGSSPTAAWFASVPHTPVDRSQRSGTPPTTATTLAPSGAKNGTNFATSVPSCFDVAIAVAVGSTPRHLLFLRPGAGARWPWCGTSDQCRG